MSDRALQAFLAVLGELVKIKRSAVFSLRGGRPSLEAAATVDQSLLDSVHLAWSTRRDEMEQGLRQQLGRAALFPLRDKEAIVGLLYVEPAFKPDAEQNKVIDLIANRLGKLLHLPRALRQIGTPETDPDQLFEAALKRSAGNVAGAARLLGVSRQTVYERMSKLGLDPGGFRVR